MSRHNVQVAARGYEHFRETGDFLEELIHPDLSLHEAGDTVGGGCRSRRRVEPIGPP